MLPCSWSCCCPTTGPPIPALTSWSCPGRRRSRLGWAESPAASETRRWGRPCPSCPCSWTSAWAPRPRPCPCPPWGGGCPVTETGGGWCGLLSQFSPRPCPAITTSSTTTTVSAHGTTRWGDDVWRCNRPARHLRQSRSGRRRHLLLFAAPHFHWFINEIQVAHVCSSAAPETSYASHHFNIISTKKYMIWSISS